MDCNELRLSNGLAKKCTEIGAVKYHRSTQTVSSNRQEHFATIRLVV